MIGVAAQEHHAARHHLLGIDVGDLEAQHLGIEPHRALDIAHIEHDMADLADAERQPAGRSNCLEPVGIVLTHPRSPRVAIGGEKPWPRKKPCRLPRILQ